MKRTLPRKFEQIVALMDDSLFEHERITARERATELAEKHGWRFEEALRSIPRAKPRDPPPTRADAYAADALAAAERERQEARQREQQARLAPLIKLYGSIGAALAPCWRERLLLDAVARWRVAWPRPDQRWTLSVDGASSTMDTPDRVRRALSSAYPLPPTFADARIEYNYWKTRDKELGLILNDSTDISKETHLDLVAWMRQRIVSNLYYHGLAAATLQELEQRAIAISEMDSQPLPREWDRVCSDIAFLAARERDDGQLHRTFRVVDRIRAELQRDKERFDREIARIVGCSPTTVGRVRRETNMARA